MRTDKPATWFRLYAEFATDPKVQMLSEVMQRRYIMLLCLRCSNGDVTLHDNEIAFQLRISEADWSETQQVLQSRNLIDADNKPSAWNKRQFAGDSSAERVARHREKLKTGVKQECNVTVTPPETETETEIKEKKEKKKSSLVGIDRFLADCKESNEKPVPEDDPVFDYAEKVGIPEDFLRLAWREFVDRNRASGKRYKDWRAAFRKCVRDNWYRIWFIGPDGMAILTTQGMAASKVHREAA